MTPEEKTNIEERLKRANELENRLRNLRDGLKKLQAAEIHSIQFPVRLGEKAELHYSTPDEPKKFFRVCWLDDDQDFLLEIFGAVTASLERRLRDTEEEYAEV